MQGLEIANPTNKQPRASEARRTGRTLQPSIPFRPSQAKGLERLEKASGKRDLHLRPRRKRRRGRPADTKSSRPRVPRSRSRCILCAQRCPRSARVTPRFHDCLADPVARCLPSARPLPNHGDPPRHSAREGTAAGRARTPPLASSASRTTPGASRNESIKQPRKASRLASGLVPSGSRDSLSSVARGEHASRRPRHPSRNL
jgi:hypothetical protein